MSTVPYSPTPFNTPIASPAVGGTGTPYPYVSLSEYQFAPTAIDTTSLVPGGTFQDQEQSLADTLRRASAWADRIVFGADPAAKGASLCATLSVEVAKVPSIRSELRLVCDYKPVIQVNGVDIGSDMSSLTSIGATAASKMRIGRRTIYIPLWNSAIRSQDFGNPNPYLGIVGQFVVVWSYVNGYPHTQLASSITAGATTCTVLPTDGATGLLGIIPNQTQLTIIDGSSTERFTVQSISGTTLTSTTAFVNSHTVPTSPDFVSVTALPADVGLAVIYLATALIKTQGDAALVLDEIREPRRKEATVGDESADVCLAKELLCPYRVRTKAKN